MRLLVRLLGLLGLLGVLPPALQLEWLRWARAEMGATHPHLPEVMREIAQFEGRTQ